MMNIPVRKAFFVVSLSFFVALDGAQSPPPQEDLSPQQEAPGFMTNVGSGLATGFEFLDANIELIQLAQALAHLPYILMVDSTNSSTIRTTAAISGSSIGLKIIYELARNRPNHYFGLARNLAIDMPKLCLFLLSMGYDVIRFLDASKVAYKNKSDGSKLKSFQINQCAQLFTEIFLRIVSFVLQRQVRNGQGSEVMAAITTEVADAIALWRLLSRYTTYFMYTKQLELNIKLQRVEDAEVSDADKLDDKEVAALTAFAQEHEIVDTKEVVGL